tara:strand:+ start:2376 stop:2798 length:423 start_codon:yes stop_codon:yes gene_type:complete
MRKITRDSINAFMNDRNFKRQNMEVRINPNNQTELVLHGNVIAYRHPDLNRTISITNCGWQTTTTKERLNGIEGVNIVQRNFQWYLNGVAWDGNLIDLNGEFFDSDQDETDRLRLHDALNGYQQTEDEACDMLYGVDNNQ